MNELSLAPILSSLVYGTLGLVLFFVTLFLMEKMTPYSLEKKITEEGNVALGIVVAAIILSLGFIFATAIR
ncbi:MAG: DUF350 domain-containing protein [Thiotrichaceae bacterium]